MVYDNNDRIIHVMLSVCINHKTKDKKTYIILFTPFIYRTLITVDRVG